jgi:hypothetical protein
LTTADLASSLLPPSGVGPGVSVAFANVAADDDRNKDKDRDKKSTKNRGDDGDEDHIAQGQVLDVNKLKDPPELIVTSMDGDMRVRVLKTDEIDLNGVKPGMYVKLYGEKINEQLFEAQMIEVETD